MKIDFTYKASPIRFVFGSGSVNSTSEETRRAGMNRPFILMSGSNQQRLNGVESSGSMIVDRQHVPVEYVHQASALFLESDADGVVAIGGGSTIGLGKALAMDRKSSFIAIPTTYSGSEATSIFGVTTDGRKVTGRDEAARPDTVIYDPELLVSLPKSTAGPSAFNALAHVAEALYAPDGNVLIAAVAGQAAALIAIGLRMLDADAVAGADQLLLGSWMAGIALDSTTMGLHHKLCHTLGGTLDLDHAKTHAVMLPFVLAYNREWIPEALATLTASLGGDELWTSLSSLQRIAGCPADLGALGVKRDTLPRLAKLAVATPYANPRAVTEQSIFSLLEAAWSGDIGKVP